MKLAAPLCAIAASLVLGACSSSSSSPANFEASTKNVIFFVGDGMGLATMTAARIYKVGEDGELTMDTLPESGFVKTFSNDAQVTDSAPSMSAYMTGVKMNNDVISMSADTKAFTVAADGTITNYVTSAGETTCPTTGNGKAVPTLLEIAKASGFQTGVVTTARLTHATPAATYSHICHRDGEYEIARQAVPGGAGFNAALGDGVDVMLGGISYFWRPTGRAGYPSGKGRKDGRDLVTELVNKGYSFASTKGELDAVQVTGGTKLIGLFDQAITQGHMSYELDRNPAAEPSLAEMTAKAIDILARRGGNGYVLVVEGGRIDHALHSTNAKRALADTVAMDDAIRAAIARVNPATTTIVVTADHDHTMVLNGYAQRTGPTTGSNAGVLGTVKDVVAGTEVKDIGGMAYGILGFGNGENRPSTRTALSDTQTAGLDYHQEAVVPMSVGGETHGGGDVFIGAIGAASANVTGVMDNTAVFGILKKALGL